ncbi:MAG: S8 family serine peptidase [Calditrichae bacterium]|nr:S8 family serine peptidase [Calditrichia bacterium]
MSQLSYPATPQQKNSVKITAMVIVCALLFVSSAWANAPRGQQQHPEAAYAPGRLLVKLTENAVSSRSFQIQSAQDGRVQTGLASLDAIHNAVNAVQMNRAHIEVKNRALDAQIGVSRWYMVEVPQDANIEAIAERYRSDANVEAATPDWQAFPAAIPNDPIYASQWGHNNTGQMKDYCWSCGGHPAGSPVGTPGFDSDAQIAWDGTQGYGSASIIIGIIDSGVDIDHPDLRLVAGWDYGSNDSNPDDNSASPGHGTACAGVAAARANNGLGVAGIAGGCSVMPLKVANNAGTMYFSSIQNALYHAADNGADIASMSLGAAISSDPATDNAILYAYNSGVTILAATGNENKSTISYPAINAYVIGVGAASPCGDRKRSSSNSSEVNPGVSTDPRGYTCDGERWWGSNYGTNSQDAAGAVDIIAPTIMPTTDIGGSGGYDPSDYSMWFNGTSCATPYAAGVAALIKSKNPSWTPAQVRAQLVSTATDVQNVESGAGWDRYSGYGMVNAGAAVGGGGSNTPPVANANGPYSGTAGVAVSFSSAGSYDPDGSISSYLWNFGDGSTSTSANPTHVYASANTYNVSLTVTDNNGAQNTDNTTATITGGGGWTVITYDNFESGMGNYTDGGSDMSRYTGGTYAHQGSAAADIQDNSGTASSFYHTANHNVTGYSTLEVDFWFRMVSMESGEDFWVQFYNGSAWQTVAAFARGATYGGVTLNNNVFYHVTITLSNTQYNFPTNAKLRFMCDASNNSDDVYIDEIEFRGLSSGAAGSQIQPITLNALNSNQPEVFELAQNYPNPFNPTTTIQYSLPEATQVRLDIYNMTGQKVRTLVSGGMEAGQHSVQWDGTNEFGEKVTSGMYIYRIVAGDFVQTRKMVLLK